MKRRRKPGHAERDSQRIARPGLSPLYEELRDVTGRRPFDGAPKLRHKLDLDIERRLGRFPEPIRRSLQANLLPRRVQEKPKVSGTDRRLYHPDKKFLGATKYGAAASIEHTLRGVPGYRRPFEAFPCHQRRERREVMFARGKAGRGYRKPKRRSAVSDITC